MIEKIQKILFIGLKDRQQEFTDKLQELGLFHIEEYNGSDLEKNEVDIDQTHAENILATYKNLKKYTDGAEDYSEDNHQQLNHFETPEEIVDVFPVLEKHLNSLKEEFNLLKVKKNSIAPWGTFELDKIKYIAEKSSTQIQFWEISVKDIDTFETPENVRIIDINHDNQRKYFLTFSKEKLVFENCLEIHYDEDIKTIESKMELNLKEQEETIKKIYSFSYDGPAIFKLYIDEINKVNYKKALSSSVNTLSGLVFAIQGWIPVNKRNKLEKEIEAFNVKVIDIEPDEKERIPTYLENNDFNKMGQDLVEFYDTPSYEDWDPSTFIFISFVVFFSMIMGDGGYGFLLFLLLLFLRVKLRKKLKPAIKRFINMGLFLTFGTTVYGIMSGGFFGLSSDVPIIGKVVGLKLFNGGCTIQDPSNPTKIIIDKEALSNMMRVSLIIGIFHISLSLFLKTLRQLFKLKDFITPFSNVAWIVAIWSFFFWWGKPFMGIPSKLDIQFNVMLGCLAVVFFTSAGTFRPGKLIVGGLGGIYNSIQFFSDIMSYIRIFALGLSGSLIALTFNNMALGIWEQGGFLTIFAVFIFVFGHTLNLALCLMSAAIHGLRLNYLEYYRWSFDGGGRPFKPLKKLSID